MSALYLAQSEPGIAEGRMPPFRCASLEHSDNCLKSCPELPPENRLHSCRPFLARQPNYSTRVGRGGSEKSEENLNHSSATARSVLTACPTGSYADVARPLAREPKGCRDCRHFSSRRLDAVFLVPRRISAHSTPRAAERAVTLTQAGPNGWYRIIDKSVTDMQRFSGRRRIRIPRPPVVSVPSVSLLTL